jgi:proline dehydrogenase
MMRAFFLFLSHRRALRRWMETSPLARKRTQRFIAGRTLDEEVAVCRQLRIEGMMSTIDRLGENVSSLDEAAQSRDGYLAVLDRIAAEHLDATISIKLTQFGLDLSTSACLENVRQLVARAKSIGSSIEVDMESHEYVDRTLEIVTTLDAEFRCVRAVVQAYLRRTENDIRMLNERRIPVRLVKGAYDEPHSVAFASKREVDASFVRLMKTLLDDGQYPAIATHDELIVGDALRYVYERKIANENFEFQMLYGIRRDLQQRLAGKGYRMRLYVPYGEAWYPYFMRRLAERPANVFFLLKNLFRS